MKKLLIIIMPFVFLYCTKTDTTNNLAIGEITETSFRGDEKWVQRHEIIVEGSIEEVWNYFTNEEEMATHVAPLIQVDFRNGGRWEASYDLQAQIGDPNNFINEVVNVIPYEQFTTKGIRVPNGLFSEEAMKALRSTMKFEEVGSNQVRVSAITTGWEQISDEGYKERVWQMAEMTNPEILKCLHVRITEGPLNWENVLRN